MTIGIIAALAIAPSVARAQEASPPPSAGDRALATALFREGRQLMAERRFRQACEKLGESHRLDPAGGTLLNLALCHEQEGRLATAWTEFAAARAIARRDRRSDREVEASQHLEALDGRLSRLTISVPAPHRVAGLTIERDRTPLGPASWSTPMPVDGGEHEIVAAAPGKIPVVLRVHVGPERDLRSVEVPLLLDEPVVPRPSGMRPARILGIALGGAGLVEAGAGIYFGVTALQKHQESNDSCPRGRCSAAGVESEVDAGRAADAATVLTTLGILSAGVGLTLVLLSPDHPERAAASLGVRPGPAGMTLEARFH